RMSDTAISRLTISSPFAVRTLRLRLFLLTFVSLKLPEVFRWTSRWRGVVVLGSRPRSFSGHSILTISAPKAPSQRVAQGPARTQLKSTTRIPSRAFMRETPFQQCSVTLDLLMPHLQRQSLVCGGAQQAERLCPTLSPPFVALGGGISFRHSTRQATDDRPPQTRRHPRGRPARGLSDRTRPDQYRRQDQANRGACRDRTAPHPGRLV